MKFGADIRRFLFNSFFTSFGRGSYRFDGRFTGHAIADLLLGASFQGDRNLGEPFHNAKTFSCGYYFQDDWKVTPKLTLNLGLRYEFHLPPIENTDKIASFDPTTNTIKVAGDREAFISGGQLFARFARASDGGCGKPTKITSRRASGWRGARGAARAP